jgi:hypothetical protein
VQRPQIHAAGWLPTLILALGGAVPLFAQVLEKPPPDYRTPTVYLPGPSYLTAVAAVPTRIDLKWAPVANATLYRLMRASPSAPEAVLEEIPANTADQDLVGKYYYHFDYLPTRSSSVTFTYKVDAVFVGADGTRTYSSPNPSASATALPIVAPPKLKFRVNVSQIMGRLRVTLDWGAVSGGPGYAVTGYHVFQVARPPASPFPMAETTVNRTTFVIDNVVPGQGATVCVYTIYDGTLKDDTVRSCVLILTTP